MRKGKREKIGQDWKSEKKIKHRYLGKKYWKGNRST
jgi:hypothetical protein